MTEEEIILNSEEEKSEGVAEETPISTTKTSPSSPTRSFLRLNDDILKRKESIAYFLASVILLAGVYLSELFHLLEKPLFSLVYNGNLNQMFFAVTSLLYIVGFLVAFHFTARKYIESPFCRTKGKIDLKRTIALYLMTLLPIIVVAIVLKFKFKIVYGLGEKITLMTLVGNATMYAQAIAKLFAITYFIYLIQRGCHLLFTANGHIPFGGIMALITFGIIEFFVNTTALSLIQLLLCLYYGVIWLVSEERFGITFMLSILLYVL